MNHDPNIVIDVEEESTGDNPEGDAVNADDMTDRLQILSNLRQKVVEEGVCRDDIEGLNNVLRGFNNEEVVSVETYLFTQERTFMNQSLALEGIGSGILAVLKAAAKKLLMAIERTYNFILKVVDKARYADIITVSYRSAYPEILRNFNGLMDLAGRTDKEEVVGRAFDKVAHKVKPYQAIAVENKGDEILKTAKDFIPILGGIIRAENYDSMMIFLMDLRSDESIQAVLKRLTPANPVKVVRDAFISCDPGLMAIGQNYDTRGYFNTLDEIKGTLKAIEKKCKDNLAKAFGDEADSMIEGIQMAGNLISKLQESVALFTEWFYQDGLAKKLLVEVFFNASRTVYEEMKKSGDGDIEAATALMKSTVDEIRQIRR